MDSWESFSAKPSWCLWWNLRGLPTNQEEFTYTLENQGLRYPKEPSYINSSRSYIFHMSYLFQKYHHFYLTFPGCTNHARTDPPLTVLTIVSTVAGVLNRAWTLWDTASLRCWVQQQGMSIVRRAQKKAAGMEEVVLTWFVDRRISESVRYSMMIWQAWNHWPKGMILIYIFCVPFVLQHFLLAPCWNSQFCYGVSYSLFVRWKGMAYDVSD